MLQKFQYFHKQPKNMLVSSARIKVQLPKEYQNVKILPKSSKNAKKRGNHDLISCSFWWMDGWTDGRTSFFFAHSGI